MPKSLIFPCWPLLKKDNLEFTLHHLESLFKGTKVLRVIQNKRFIGVFHHTQKELVIICVRLLLLFGIGLSQLNSKWWRKEGQEVGENKDKPDPWGPTGTHVSPPHPWASNFSDGGASSMEPHRLLAWGSQTPAADIGQELEQRQAALLHPRWPVPNLPGLSMATASLLFPHLQQSSQPWIVLPLSRRTPSSSAKEFKRQCRSRSLKLKHATLTLS